MSVRVPADQLQLVARDLQPGQEYQFAIRAWGADGPGEVALFNPVIPLPPVTIPSPWDPPYGSEIPYALPHHGSFNGWEFGEGTRWPINDDESIFALMALRTQDAPLAGDGSVFGWDTETPKTVNFEIQTTFAEMAALCGHSLPIYENPLLGPRCAMLPRSDELPLRLDEFVLMARPRRFVPPGRRDSPRLLQVGWELPDPALYLWETGDGTVDGWRYGEARVGVFEAGRPYPRQEPGGPVEEGRQYRGPAGTAEGTWRYEGRQQSGLLEVVNLGCRPTPLLVRLTGPVDGPILVNQRTFERLQLDLQIADGDWVDLDFRLGRVLLNGTANRYDTLTRDSTWWLAGGGITLVRYLCRGEVTTSTAMAWYRSAW